MDALTAIRAYTQAGATGGAGGASEAAAPGFDDMLSGFLNQATDATRAAEGQMAAHVNGQTDLVGVVTAITPFNGAIIMAFQKLIPALMAGNSVILRPSPLTPLSSLAFGEAAAAAGLPAGVLSVVVEEGAAGVVLRAGGGDGRAGGGAGAAVAGDDQPVREGDSSGDSAAGAGVLI